MRNLVKYVGIGLLVMGLAACDNSDSKAPTVGAAAESNASGQAISLLDGKLSFTLPAGMADQRSSSSSATAPMKIWRCWRNAWKISSAAATRSCRW